MISGITKMCVLPERTADLYIDLKPAVKAEDLEKKGSSESLRQNGNKLLRTILLPLFPERCGMFFLILRALIRKAG